MKDSILIIDNDPLLTSLLATHLALEGYESTAVHDGESGLKKALNLSFNAIILDITLSKLNGFELIKRIREQTDTPIIVLTSRADQVDRLVSFELGADDYLIKPCSPYDLIAKLKAILQRRPKTPQHKPMIQYENLVVNCNKRLASLAGKEVELTNTEFRILELLIKTPHQAFSKEELTEYSLGRKFTPYDRSIDVHISNLRNKIGLNGKEEPWIKTVRGFGYQFDIGL